MTVIMLASPRRSRCVPHLDVRGMLENGDLLDNQTRTGHQLQLLQRLIKVLFIEDLARKVLRETLDIPANLITHGGRYLEESGLTGKAFMMLPPEVCSLNRVSVYSEAGLDVVGADATGADAAG